MGVWQRIGGKHLVKGGVQFSSLASQLSALSSAYQSGGLPDVKRNSPFLGGNTSPTYTPLTTVSPCTVSHIVVQRSNLAILGVVVVDTNRDKAARPLWNQQSAHLMNSSMRRLIGQRSWEWTPRKRQNMTTERNGLADSNMP